MRALLWLVAVGALLFGGYWFVGSRTLRSGVETTLDALEFEGLARHGELSLTGFPARFDLTVTEPEWIGRDSVFGWRAPWIRIHALSYRPHHVIAVLPEEQTLRIGREELTLATRDLSASAVFGLSPALPLERAQTVGVAPVLTSPRGWGLSGTELRLAIRRGEGDLEHEVGAELIAPELTGAPVRLLGAGLPANGERLRLDAVFGLDEPLDRHILSRGIRIRSADIRALDLDWGTLELRGTGQIELDARGTPEGRIALSVRDWRAALDAAIGLGLVRDEIRPTLTRALEILALTSGQPDDLSLPLTFHNGFMSLGPVPLGPAPHF
ncbi:hypothetical protein DEA8626_00480 [Defluviimonas aquaemixtae]|uniref:DUF2125 domain-containing protein n=1 Tax=Albidovulum aquaemixtae TaxID=1542388 RepID=A0A2R8B2V9_9RHOB|nr:DUF2125 domain-containing protein [Defluviimonas aquaemixtae]SPH16966.1 hypothetical protein DEA8626_00480 [Defluviimonas aquaemixtae]